MNRFDRKLKRSGLTDPPITIVVGDEDFEPVDTEIHVHCPRCGLSEVLHGTRFIPGTDEDDARLHLAFHTQWDCPRPTLWWWFMRTKESWKGRVLGWFGYRATAWGVKHKSWKPNIKR